MALTTRQLVLLVTDSLDTIHGKTALQKQVYFAGVLATVPVDYRPHYYGPYSDSVSTAATSLISNGLLLETRRGMGVADSFGGEVTRFDYQLTDRGKDAIAWLENIAHDDTERVREAVKKMQAAGSIDYRSLSLAAKTHWLVVKESRPLTFGEICERAKTLSWEVTDSQARAAAEFLSKLGLVTVEKKSD